MDIGQTTIKQRTSGEPYNIFWTGDWHKGHVCHDAAALNKTIHTISDVAREEPTGVFLMGDLGDSIFPGDKRFNSSEVARVYKGMVDDQVREIREAIRPIAPHILAAVTGNHEGAYTRHNYSDIYTRYTSECSHPDFKRLGYVGFYRLLFVEAAGGNRRSLTCWLNHGKGGGGKREGYPKNKLHDLFRWIDADICAAGHIHKLEMDRKTFSGINAVGKFMRRVRWYLGTGCMLRTYVPGKENYFEGAGAAESDVGYVHARIVWKRPMTDRHRTNKPEIDMQLKFID